MTVVSFFHFAFAYRDTTQQKQRIMSSSYDDTDPMHQYVAQASRLWGGDDGGGGQLPLLIAISFLLGLGKGGVPGFATVATACTVATAPLDIQGGLGYAVSLMVPVLASIDVYAAWLHRTQLDWTSVRLLLPLSFVGMVVGQVLDRHMSDATSRIVVGTLLLSILLLRVYKTVFKALGLQICGADDGDEDKRRRKKSSFLHRKDSDESYNGNGERHALPLSSTSSSVVRESSSSYAASSVGWASAVGLIGGASTMLTNSMGPILNVYLLSVRKLPPSSYVGTRAVFFCFLNLFKIPMRFAAGTLGWSMVFPLGVGLGGVAVLGVYCAKPIMLSLSERAFVGLELAVVAFAGIRLLYMGLVTK